MGGCRDPAIDLGDGRLSARLGAFNIRFWTTRFMNAALLFRVTLESALTEISSSGLPVFTFAMYRSMTASTPKHR